MPGIANAALTVATHRPQDRASVIVSCDIAFTEVEVNAMNILGLQYTLQCKVLNKDVLDDYVVVLYSDVTFPRIPGEARAYEHVLFEEFAPTNTLHERLIGKDKLVAELKLKNDETETELIQRTEVLEVDLAA